MLLGLGKVVLSKDKLVRIQNKEDRDYLNYHKNGALLIDQDVTAGTVTLVVLNEGAFNSVFVPTYTVEEGEHSDVWSVSLF